MRISTSWLSDYVKVNESLEDLSEMLTMLGLEAEISSNFSEVKGLIVGKITSVRKHPNADKLSLVTVFDGSQSVEVVCGAPNVRENLSIPFAPVGSSLPGGFILKKVTIRGIESTGMICSERELGISDEHEGIMELPDNLKIGTSISKWLKSEFSAIDLDLTPNRSDALSHIGVARDLAVKTGRTLTIPTSPVHKAVSPSKDHISVTIDDKIGCPRYIAGIVNEITVGPSPEWMVTKLKAAGLRSINNVVDISNFVLLEFGHPTHMFDLDKIPGKAIQVRKAKKGESILGLDGEKYTFNPDHCLITDGKNPLAIAGIMGGEDSGVTKDTTSILIESAYFDPITIRKGAKSLGLRTEASRRFERGADINGCVAAYNRVVQLLIDFAGGNPIKGYIDAYPKKFKQTSVTLRRSELDLISGQRISDAHVSNTLKGLGMIVKKNASSWSCNIPTYRPDLEREIDLIEEIIRIYGYDNVPSSVHFSGVHSSRKPDPEASIEDVVQFMAGFGFGHCYSNSLESKRIASAHAETPVAMKNPLSEKMAFLRTTLIPGLIQKIDFNIANGRQDLRLYEIGNVFVQKKKGLKGIHEKLKMAGVIHGNWTDKDIHHSTQIKSSLFVVKGVITSIAARFGIQDLAFLPCKSDIFSNAQTIRLSGNDIGTIGIVNTSFIQKIKSGKRGIYGFEFEFQQIVDALDVTTQFKQINAYPVSERDLNFVLSDSVSVGDVLESMQTKGGDILKLVSPVNEFSDESIGSGNRSVTFRLVFQHPSKTLEDSDVNPLIKGIIDVVSKIFDGKLRS